MLCIKLLMTERLGSTQPLDGKEPDHGSTFLQFSLNGRNFNVGKKVVNEQDQSVRLSVHEVGASTECAFLTGYWSERDGKVTYLEIGMENLSRDKGPGKI